MMHFCLDIDQCYITEIKVFLSSADFLYFFNIIMLNKILSNFVQAHEKWRFGGL
jgi:hypothetical protein